MSYSTIESRSVKSNPSSDWQSYQTNTTGASSRTTTYTSTRSNQSQSDNSLNLVICLKMALVVFTLLGGAILALCINLIKRSDSTTYAADEYDRLQDEVPEELKYGPIANCRFKNREKKLCLNAYNASRHDKEKADMLLVDECKSDFMREQFFSSESDSLTVTRGSGMNDMCASAVKQYLKMVPCSEGNIDQMLSYMANEQLYHYKTKRCLTTREVEKGDLVKLERCSDTDLHQKWICGKVAMRDLSLTVDTNPMSRLIIIEDPRKGFTHTPDATSKSYELN